jgi:hypothetical protein
MNKELLELHGLLLGDGTYYLDRGKYPHMIFFNFDLSLMKRVKRICEKISKKKIKISCRKRKTGLEYSMNIPAIVVRKLLEQGFDKKRLSEAIINDKNSIFLLKGLYESDGSIRGSRICIYQKNASELLKDLQKIANLNGLSAHIHNSSRNRKGEQYLVIEDVNKVRKLFGPSPKMIKQFKPKIKGYYTTKRIILQFLNSGSWKKTSEIYEYLKINGNKLSKRSNQLNRHLNKLWELGLLEKRGSILKRNEKGQFIKSECEWKLKRRLTNEEIMNFPYGVLK